MLHHHAGLGPSQRRRVDHRTREAPVDVRIRLVVVGIVASVASIIFAVQRLKNIGWPWFFLFLSLVPIVNLWISLALLGYPPGYAHHRRFDTAAKVIFGIAGLLIAGGITAAIIAFNRKA